MGKNLVFIMTDHQRVDSIGMVQDNKEVTPVLNNLADQSTQFNMAYNTCPLCVPARTALATSKYPTRNGVVHNDLSGKLARDHKTIHEYLKDGGYNVAHVGINHIQVAPSLKDRMVFDHWVDDDSYNQYAKEKNIKIVRNEKDVTVVKEFQDGEYRDKAYSNARVSLWEHSLEDYKDMYFAREAMKFIKKQKDDKPFALFLYFWAPHPPLKVPAEYATMFDPNNLTLPSNVGIASPKEPKNRRKGIAAQLAQELSGADWNKVWSAHLGLVRMADDAIGDVLSTLKDTNNYHDTIVVFTTDHGDHLGQHNMYQKMEMYDQAIKVPFLYKAPNTTPKQWDVPVSHLDIMPTLLDMLKISYPSNLDGISLAPSIQGEVAPPDKPVFCQYSGNPTVGDIRRAVVQGQYKYIYDPRDTAELYHLIEDPLEMNNLSGVAEHAQIEKDLHDKCMTWAREHGDWIKW